MTGPQPDDAERLYADAKKYIDAAGEYGYRPREAILCDELLDRCRTLEAERLTPQEMVELMALVIMAGPNVPRSIDPIMRKMGDIIRRSEIKP